MDISADRGISLGDMPQFSMEVNQALLKEDDDLLRQIFSQVFRHHHPDVANKVDVIFSLAQVRSYCFRGCLVPRAKGVLVFVRQLSWVFTCSLNTLYYYIRRIRFNGCYGCF